MNATTHDELIESLAALRRALPSMRLGQLVTAAQRAQLLLA